MSPAGPMVDGEAAQGPHRAMVGEPIRRVLGGGMDPEFRDRPPTLGSESVSISDGPQVGDGPILGTS